VKNSVRQVFRLYNFIIWTILSILGLIALGKILHLAILDIASQKEIFIPGVIALILGILLIEAFFITRMIKYIKMLMNNK